VLRQNVQKTVSVYCCPRLQWGGPIGERCKDHPASSQRVSADNTLCMGAFDPILSHIDGLANSHPQTIFVQFYMCLMHFGSWLSVITQESSAKLTNQRVSYAFTSSPFNFHAFHILPAFKFQYSYSSILLIFYRHQWTACMRTVSVNTVHWFDASSSVNPNE